MGTFGLSDETLWTFGPDGSVVLVSDLPRPNLFRIKNPKEIVDMVSFGATGMALAIPPSPLPIPMAFKGGLAAIGAGTGLLSLLLDDDIKMSEVAPAIIGATVPGRVGEAGAFFLSLANVYQANNNEVLMCRP